MKNYEGIRKEMKEAGWSRHDRSHLGVPEELWKRPGGVGKWSDFLYSFESACRRFKIDQAKKEQP